MMKIYFHPSMEVVNFAKDDVIRTSGDPIVPPQPAVERGDNLYGLTGEDWQ